MHRLTKALFALALLAALAFPAIAPARRSDSEREHRRNPVVAYQFKGKVAAVDGQVVTLTVARANRHSRQFRGQDVQFDVTDAKIRVKDRNGDGERNLADVAVGDRAVVTARLPKRLAQDATQPFTAKKLIAKAQRAPDPEDDGGDTEAPPPAE
jgi:hypothetical protein